MRKKELIEAPYLVRLRKISPWSLAKIGAAFYGLIGLVSGIILTSVSYLLPQSTTGIDPSLGLAVLLAAPVIYTVLGFFGGLLAAVFLNVAVRLVGPIKLKIFLAHDE